MDDKLLRYTLRVDRLLFQKFRYIAESEGRSANKEIEQYLKKRVTEYEEANGKIEVKQGVPYGTPIFLLYCVILPHFLIQILTTRRDMI